MRLNKLWALLAGIGFMLVSSWALAEDSVTNDNCMMCHRPMVAELIPAHSRCLTCHQDGAAEHATNPRVAPAAVGTETCQMCHRPTEAFRAPPYHRAEIDCAACHFIHRPKP